VNRFKREHVNVRVEVIQFGSDTERHFISVIDAWEQEKLTKNKSYELEHEKAAMQRLLQISNYEHLVVIGIFEGQQMLAFSIDEILSDNYCIGHFWKADTKCTGIYDVLLQEKSLHFKSLGCTLLNYEQDLGIEGLRKSKMDYRSVNFLKKYRISSGK